MLISFSDNRCSLMSCFSFPSFSNFWLLWKKHREKLNLCLWIHTSSIENTIIITHTYTHTHIAYDRQVEQILKRSKNTIPYFCQILQPQMVKISVMQIQKFPPRCFQKQLEFVCEASTCLCLNLHKDTTSVLDSPQGLIFNSQLNQHFALPLKLKN